MRITQQKPLRLFAVAAAALLMTTGCGKEAEQDQPEPRVQEKLSGEQARSAVDDAAPILRDLETDDTAKPVDQESEPVAAADVSEPVREATYNLQSEVEDQALETIVIDEEPQISTVEKLKTYTVESGDNLASIAASHYDDPARYLAIYEANRDVLSDPDSLEVGQVLKLP